MKRTFLRTWAISAACSMLLASAWAQSPSPDQPMNDSSANRSWSTKHLSATGRETHQAVRASKLSGAPVSDSSGQRVGTIQDCIINPASGRVEFALLSLNSTSTSSTTTSSTTSTSENTMSSSASGKLVPVPWSLLRTSASSQYSMSSEQPTFTLNVDQNKLTSAPTVDTSDLSQSQWQQRIYSYYGVTPQPMGSAESPQGEMKGQETKGQNSDEIKGEPARRMEETTPQRQTQPTP